MWDIVQLAFPPTYLSNAVSATHWFRPLSPIDIQVIRAFDHLFRTIYRACLMLGLVEMNEVQDLCLSPPSGGLWFWLQPLACAQRSTFITSSNLYLTESLRDMICPGQQVMNLGFSHRGWIPQLPVLLCVWLSACLCVFHENRLPTYARFSLFFPMVKVNWSKRERQSKEVFGEKQKKKILSHQVDLMRESMKRLCELICIINMWGEFFIFFNR